MWWLPILSAAAAACSLAADIQVGPIHIRSGAEREWNEFPAGHASALLSHTFTSTANTIEHTLSIRQRDVKNPAWTVTINGQILGVLASDERDMRTYLVIPPGVLRDGNNILEIAVRTARASDDIELREIRIHPKPRAQLLRESTVRVETGADEPCRITVVDDTGALVPLGPMGNPEREAVRTGVVYTADGRTEIGLPAGNYKVYASRGWAYNAPSGRAILKPGKRKRLRLRLRREVDLPGYISCDTHVHTLELSGHGDANVRERVITAAGEGLDMIIVTEHDRISDYSETVRKLGLERVVHAVSGSEVTTQLGHFNVFPLVPNASSPPNRPQDWTTLVQSIKSMDGQKVIVQNHPRDLHLNYRPFDPVHHLSSAGENLIGRSFFANAMEVINSGAMSSDMLQLVRDWMGLLNRGDQVAAIGASDTHTVDFVPIGQARTLIRSNGTEEAFERLAAGDNLVSYGLAATLRVETVKPLVAAVEVHGPSWSSADRLTVYSNGLPVVDATLPVSRSAGRKWVKRITIPNQANDVTLVAVASGPGVLRPFWEVRKPYQPMSRDWVPRVMGISGAVRVDIDGNGFQSPRSYAEAVLRSNNFGALDRFDDSVSVQLLSLAAANGQDPESFVTRIPERAYQGFMSEWRAAKPPSTSNSSKD
jgi:hypothetical protein